MTFNELCEQHKLTHEERVLALAYLSEFRPLRRDSLCPSGATLVSTMPAPSGFLGWATGEKISGFSRFLILIKYEKQK